MSSSQRGPGGSSSAPVYPHSHSTASASTASSLTQPNTPYRDNDDSSHPYPPTNNNNNDDLDLDLDLDLEDPDALADDVAFIQKQRSSSTTPKNTRFLIKLKGFFTVLAIISAALLLIPLLQWLSSAPFASSPLGEAIASIPGIKNTTIFNITLGSTPSLPQDHENHTPAIPEVGTLTGNLPSAHKYGASADTAFGNWGLGRAKAGGFQTQFYLPGWGDALSASKVLGIPAPPKNDAVGTSAADHLRPLTMDNVLDGTFYAARSDLAWCPEDPDEGVFSHVDPITKDIILEDVTHARLNRTGVGKVAVGGGYSLFVRGDDVTDDRGAKLDWSSFTFSPNMRWAMFFSGKVKQWRHSSHSYIWLHDIVSRKTYPLRAPDGMSETSPTISYARWIPLPNGAPTFNDPIQPPGPALVFVHKNDLYLSLTPTSKPIRITSDGAGSIFNGVPDWVYEEEVFSSDYALWPSPTGTHLVYLRFDEREVPIYEYPIYNPDYDHPGKTKPYPEKVKMKYPNPGYPNPVVSVHSVDLEALRKVGEGREPTWQEVQGAKRVLVSPAKTKIPSASSQGTGMSLESMKKVDEALAAGPQALHSRLVTEVVWLTPSQVLIKESNRVSDKMRAVVFDVDDSKKQGGGGGSGEYKEREIVGEVVRSEDADVRGGSGWIEPFQTVRPLNDRNHSAKYIDLAPSSDGFRHIALFDPSSSFKPTFLTGGRWEVDKIKFVDEKRGKVYFTAAYPTAAQRHLFEVSILPPPPPSSGGGKIPSPPKALTDLSKPGFYDASFDPKGAYYTLYDNGPGVPSQRVLGLGGGREKKEFELVLEDNAFLRKTLGMYLRPSSLFYSIEIDSQKASKGENEKLQGTEKVKVAAMELRPHDFDASGRTRYPVLIFIYGGPNSQSVSASYARPDWHAYLASTLGYIVITLDGRGTGFQGFGYRAAVRGRLGELEGGDVVEAARKIGKLAYVDEKRVGIRGWSYGGYLTSKVVERDSGVFSLGMAVAPVTRWQFYDSIYTERYMQTPALNPTGYESSAVHITDGFRHTDFFLASGSADDNVHPTNIYHLLDSLTAAKIRRYEFRHFADSDHGISTRGAYRELHEFMTAFLQRRWGAGGRRKVGKVMTPVRRGGEFDRVFDEGAVDGEGRL